MKKNFKKILALALTLMMTLSLAACGDKADAPAASGDGGASGEPVRIKLSTVLTEESLTGKALGKFAEDIAAKSDGRITCDVYYSGVLGTTAAVQEMMYEGGIQMMTVNPVAFETQVKELATLDQYYMFDDLNHAHRFLEGEGGKYLNDSWQSIKMQGMATFGLGFRELSNNKKEIKTIEDMKALTLRGYSTIQIAAWQAVGATPTSVDWNELFVGMQQGLLDGQESALSTMNDFSFYEVQKYITMTDHVFTADMLLASTEWLESLSAEDRTLIEETMNEAYLWHKEAYQADLESLQTKFADEHGLVITELDDSVKAEMKEKMYEASKAEIIKVCGQETYDKTMGYVEAARA